MYEKVPISFLEAQIRVNSGGATALLHILALNVNNVMYCKYRAIFCFSFSPFPQKTPIPLKSIAGKSMSDLLGSGRGLQN